LSSPTVRPDRLLFEQACFRYRGTSKSAKFGGLSVINIFKQTLEIPVNVKFLALVAASLLVSSLCLADCQSIDEVTNLEIEQPARMVSISGYLTENPVAYPDFAKLIAASPNYDEAAYVAFAIIPDSQEIADPAVPGKTICLTPQLTIAIDHDQIFTAVTRKRQHRHVTVQGRLASPSISLDDMNSGMITDAKITTLPKTK